ncbi:MAG: oligosaccharide flippase family protein [Myxococcales bacterium]|nr:oligosaccharide flippase family protein [Myxococcales bacterium]
MASGADNAGRGVLFLAAAKGYFMVAGYAIVFSLPRLLGDAASWGDYGVVIAWVSVIDNVIVTATIQGISRFTATADSPQAVEAVKAAGLRGQLMLGGVIAVIYGACAPLIASWEEDPSLAPMVRLSAGIVLCYAFYAVFIGSLNGQRRFGRQAAFDVAFATLRAAMILGAAALSLGALGAVGGFVGAAFVVLLASALVVGLPRPRGERFAASEIVRFMARLFVYNLALNLLLRVDLLLIKRMSGALSGAASAAARAKAASTTAGFYASAQYIAFIPYQAIVAVAFVIFPLVSRTTFDEDLATTQAYIRKTLRLSLIFVAGLAATLCANPEALLGVPFPAPYRVAAPALRLLAAGMIGFSMFTIINTVLNGAGRTTLAILSGVLTLGGAALANYLAIGSAATPAEAMARAAAASAGAMLVGSLVAGLLLYRTFRAGIAPLTLLRVAIAAGAAVALGWLLPEVSKVVTLAESALVFVAYLVVLVITGELGKRELAEIKRLVRR